jgi:hypothetical protein
MAVLVTAIHVVTPRKRTRGCAGQARAGRVGWRRFAQNEPKPHPVPCEAREGRGISAEQSQFASGGGVLRNEANSKSVVAGLDPATHAATESIHELHHGGTEATEQDKGIFAPKTTSVLSVPPWCNSSWMRGSSPRMTSFAIWLKRTQWRPIGGAKVIRRAWRAIWSGSPRLRQNPKVQPYQAYRHNMLQFADESMGQDGPRRFGGPFLPKRTQAPRRKRQANSTERSQSYRKAGITSLPMRRIDFIASSLGMRPIS